MTASQFHALQVAGVEPETDNAIKVSFNVPSELADIFRYKQGQYLTFRTDIEGEEIRRSYSICAAVQDPQPRVGIKKVPDGRFSSWANDHLRAGTMLEL